MTTEKTGLAETIFSKGALMGLHIGRWTGVKKMRPNDMLMKSIDEDALYLGHKKLLPSKALERLIELEGKARTTLANRSMDFPIAGARFVTYSALTDIIEDLTDLKTEWNREVEELIAEYPRMKADQLATLNRQAEAFMNEELGKTPAADYKRRKEELEVWLREQQRLNESFYPTVDELRSKFSFTWRMFTIQSVDGITELEGDEVRAAQQRLREDLQTWVRAAASEMHKSLGEAAANARDLLEKNGKLTPRNLSPLFNAFESFLSVDFTGKSTFRETIDTIKKKFLVQNPDGTYNLGQMAENVSTERGSLELKGMLKIMGELAVQETADKAGVAVLGATDFGRMVEI